MLFFSALLGLSIIYTEVLARLFFFVPSYPEVIGKLCQQCLSWFSTCPHPVLIPSCGFLQPPAGPLHTTLTGFLKGITVMALSSDCRLLVAGSQNGSKLVWNMEVIEMLHALPGHSAEVRCVKVFGKGTCAVSAAMDHSLCIWNLISGRVKFVIQVTHIEEQPSHHLHVDERHRIVYFSSDKKVGPFFSLKSAKRTRTIEVTATVMKVIDRKSTLVNVWHLETAELIFQISAEVSGEKQFSYPSFMSNFCLISLQISSDENSLLEKLPGRVCFVVTSEDESILQHFGSGSDTYSPRTNFSQVWSLSEQGLLMDTLDGMGAPVTHLALYDCTLVSDSCSVMYFRVWNLVCKQQQEILARVTDTGCTAVSHRGNYVYLTQPEDRQEVIIWDATEGAVCDTLDTSAQVRCLEIAEQTQLLFTGLMSGTVLVFPPNSKQDVACIPPPESQKPVNHMAINKHEKQLAIAYDDLVLVLDIIPADPCPVIHRPTYTFYTQIPGALVSRVAVLADYRVLYGMTTGDLFLYDCPQSQVFPLEGHRSQISCLESSHGEHWALSGAEDSLQCLWDLESCQQEHEMCYYKPASLLKGIRCACFSKDDKYLYTGSLDQTITAWDVGLGFLILNLVSAGAVLAVQCIHTTATRIVPTADGFVATTKLCYIIREKFHCPTTTSQYNTFHSPQCVQ
ncbi:LOW QUALITY PROTEIN: NACHT domain- and WD repeat-containing protein 1 [Anas acuta]|uniref:LOW QUALITY PROTEIN: NACHT domain- and WD repeat-containing protein 1 n=1 Tax=Anas acuta TaxID=28680 RepID=UPI0035C8A860